MKTDYFQAAQLRMYGYFFILDRLLMQQVVYQETPSEYALREIDLPPARRVRNNTFLSLILHLGNWNVGIAEEN